VQQLYRELEAKGIHKFRPLVISLMNGDVLLASLSSDSVLSGNPDWHS